MSDYIDLSSILQRFSTRVLWHFTGYGKTPQQAFEILNAILAENCLRVSGSQEAINMPDGKTRFGFPIACTCDIPFGDLRIHMVRYGPVGVAFHKWHAIARGHFNPVLYLHKDSPAFRAASDLVAELEKLVGQDTPVFAPLQRLLMLLGSYSKRSDLLHPAELNPEKDKLQDNNFYYEREWRTAMPWKFEDAAIAAIMIPAAFFSDFRARWPDRFRDSSLISSEMVGAL